jgi:hypothetical protein
MGRLASPSSLSGHRTGTEHSPRRYHTEPIVFVAERGELHPDEIYALEIKAAEAQVRIAGGRERSGSGGLDLPDRRAIKLWEEVKTALTGPRMTVLEGSQMKHCSNHCRGCDSCFTSLAAFDAHRTGPIR